MGIEPKQIIMIKYDKIIIINNSNNNNNSNSYKFEMVKFWPTNSKHCHYPVIFGIYKTT